MDKIFISVYIIHSHLDKEPCFFPGKSETYGGTAVKLLSLKTATVSEVIATNTKVVTPTQFISDNALF